MITWTDILLAFGLLLAGVIGWIIVMLLILWASRGDLNPAEGWYKKKRK